MDVFPPLSFFVRPLCHLSHSFIAIVENRGGFFWCFVHRLSYFSFHSLFPIEQIDIMSETQELTNLGDKKAPKVAVDQAWDYLETHGATSASDEPYSLKALRRKIDWRIVPLMFCCYTMQFIDKVLINVRIQFLALSMDYLGGKFLPGLLSSMLLSWA